MASFCLDLCFILDNFWILICNSHFSGMKFPMRCRVFWSVLHYLNTLFIYTDYIQADLVSLFDIMKESTIFFIVRTDLTLPIILLVFCVSMHFS